MLTNGKLRRSLTILGVPVENAEALIKTHFGPLDSTLGSQGIDSDLNSVIGMDVLSPPINFRIWAKACEQNVRLSRCIRTYARNTAGLGWWIDPLVPLSGKEAKPALVREAKRQSEIIRALLDHPNEKMPFISVSYHEKTDEEAVGNGYYEIVRDNALRVAKIYRLPSSMVYIRKDLQGFVQWNGLDKRFFKNFGDTRFMDRFTGEFKRSLPLARRANELIHFRVHSPASVHYGIPRYLAASPAITGTRMTEERNVAFFENDALPRFLLSIMGGQLNAESRKLIQAYFRGASGKGVENAKRGLLLEVEAAANRAFAGREVPVKIQLDRFDNGLSADALFLEYMKNNEEKIREAFGIANSFFTTSDANRASARESVKITHEQEFEPDRVEREFIINQFLIPDMLNGGYLEDTGGIEVLVAFRLKRPDLTDPLEQAQIDRMNTEIGVSSPNEIRKRRGEDPWPDDFHFGEIPFPLTIWQLRMGVVASVAGKAAVPPQLGGSTAKPGLKKDKRADPDILKTEATMLEHLYSEYHDLQAAVDSGQLRLPESLLLAEPEKALETGSIFEQKT